MSARTKHITLDEFVTEFCYAAMPSGYEKLYYKYNDNRKKV